MNKGPCKSTDILAPGIDSRFSSLHTKTFIIDRETVYIGSLNMDPRSFHLNTEMGLLIAAPALAVTICRMFSRPCPVLASQPAFTAFPNNNIAT